MQNYEIVVESAVGLSSELRRKYHLYDDVIRGVIYLPGKDVLADTEWKDISPVEYFKVVKKNAGKVHTAFGTFEEFSRVITPILEKGKDVIVYTISSGISGAYSGFRSYVDILLDDFPGRKVEIIDTLKFDAAGALLAIHAAENRDKGMSFEDNVKWSNENRFCLHEIGPMDDLRFLAKNGRIKAAKAFFGQLAGVQPVADFTTDGMSQPLGTVRGDKAVDELSLKYLMKTIVNPEEQVVVIAHSDREARAKTFKENLEKALKVKEVVLVSVGQSCGPNIGPGLCAYYYMGNKISDDREEETKLFLSLKENA